jgi:hypothetical protein
MPFQSRAGFDSFFGGGLSGFAAIQVWQAELGNAQFGSRALAAIVFLANPDGHFLNFEPVGRIEFSLLDMMDPLPSPACY